MLRKPSRERSELRNQVSHAKLSSNLAAKNVENLARLISLGHYDTARKALPSLMRKAVSLNKAELVEDIVLSANVLVRRLLQRGKTVETIDLIFSHSNLEHILFDVFDEPIFYLNMF